MDRHLHLVTGPVIAHPDHPITRFPSGIENSYHVAGPQIRIDAGQQRSTQANLASAGFGEKPLSFRIHAPDRHDQVSTGARFLTAIEVANNSHGDSHHRSAMIPRRKDYAAEKTLEMREQNSISAPAPKRKSFIRFTVFRFHRVRYFGYTESLLIRSRDEPRISQRLQPGTTPRHGGPCFRACRHTFAGLPHLDGKVFRIRRSRHDRSVGAKDRTRGTAGLLS